MKRLIFISLVLSYTLASDMDICGIPVEKKESWNLVGLPVYVSDNSYQTVFPREKKSKCCNRRTTYTI